jgi:hypothetical protein
MDMTRRAGVKEKKGAHSNKAKQGMMPTVDAGPLCQCKFVFKMPTQPTELRLHNALIQQKRFLAMTSFKKKAAKTHTHLKLTRMVN